MSEGGDLTIPVEVRHAVREASEVTQQKQGVRDRDEAIVVQVRGAIVDGSPPPLSPLHRPEMDHVASNWAPEDPEYPLNR